MDLNLKLSVDSEPLKSAIARVRSDIDAQWASELLPLVADAELERALESRQDPDSLRRLFIGATKRAIERTR